MDIQTQIEQAVTNGRGYNRTGSGFGNSETDSDAALQARLAWIEGEVSQKKYGLFYNPNFESDSELTQLDNDLKNLGYKDTVTTPEQVEQALKIKRYLVSLATEVFKMHAPKKLEVDSEFGLLLKKDYSNLDGFILKEEFPLEQKYFLGGNLSDFVAPLLAKKEVYKTNKVKSPKKYIVVSGEFNEKPSKKH